jgi:hypothetical protein
VTPDNITEFGIDAYRAALAGNDAVVLPGVGSALTSAGFYDATFSGGSGDDSLILDGTIGLTLNQIIQVVGNSGNDQFIIEPVDIAGQTIGKLTLDSGTGDDQYIFENITSATELSIVESSALPDTDILQILSPSGQSLQVAESMFNLGLGNDTYLIDGNLLNSRIVDAAGESFITITGSITGDNYNDSSITTGAQDDVITVSGTVTNAAISTAAGDDDIFISGVVTNSVIDAQDGNNTVTTGSLLDLSEIVFNGGSNIVNVNGDVANSYIYTLATDSFDDHIIIQGNLSDEAIIQLSNGDDTVVVEGSIENTAIRGGGGNNTITLNNNVTNTNINSAGSGNQWVTIDGNFTVSMVNWGQIIFQAGNYQIDVSGSIIGADDTHLVTISAPSLSGGSSTISAGGDIQFTRVFLGDGSDFIDAINIANSIIDMGTGGVDQIRAFDPMDDSIGSISDSTISMGTPGEPQDNILSITSPIITNTTFTLQGSTINQLLLEGTSVGGSVSDSTLLVVTALTTLRLH